MDKATRKAFIELEERVAELERQVERLMNHEPGWTEERVEEIPQEIFALLTVYLSSLNIGFSIEAFREFVLEVSDATLDSVSDKFPGEVEKNMIGWERMIIRHILSTMLPRQPKEDQSETPSSPD